MFCGPIDWLATGTMIGGLGTWAGAVAIVFAAFLGRNALANFHAQKLVERRIEYAEKLLSQIRVVNDSIIRIRQKYPSAGEAEHASQILESSGVESGPPFSPQHVDATIARERLKTETTAFEGLRELIPLTEAYFGAEVAKQARRFLRIPHMITNHANRLWNVGHDDGVDQTLYYTGNKSDTITTELQKSSDALNKALVPQLRSANLDNA